MTHHPTTMSHSDLIAALRRHLPEVSDRWRRYALELLLDYDNGAWFTDPFFVTKVIDDETGSPDRVEVDFVALARLLDSLQHPKAWTYSHGPTGSRVLWLACELAVGRFGELVQNLDDGTDEAAREPIRALFTRLFQLDAAPGTE